MAQRAVQPAGELQGVGLDGGQGLLDHRCLRKLSVPQAPRRDVVEPDERVAGPGAKATRPGAV
ncbi:hypothetical protein ABTK28_21320, partial [Acinetobacter baumannii]